MLNKFRIKLFIAGHLVGSVFFNSAAFAAHPQVQIVSVTEQHRCLDLAKKQANKNSGKIHFGTALIELKIKSGKLKH